MREDSTQYYIMYLVSEIKKSPTIWVMGRGDHSNPIFFTLSTKFVFL